MVLTTISAYRQAGHTFDDEDVDKNANIETSKLATRTLSLQLNPIAAVKAGAAIAADNSGVFAGIPFPNTTASFLYWSFPKPVEYDSGDVILRILWNSPATSGDLKIVSDIKSATAESTLVSGAQDSGTLTVDGTTNDLNILSITIAAADFNVNEFIGLRIQRDPADGADTLADTALILAASLVYQGRG